MQPYSTYKPSGIDWIGNIPSHWKLSKIGYVSNVVRGASPRPAGDPKYFNGDNTPWITVGEVTKDDNKYLISVSDYLTKEGAEQSRYVKEGTLLLSNSGATLGVPKILKIGGCINDGSVAFLTLAAEVSIDFIYYFFKPLTLIYREMMKGSGQPNLNTDIVKSTAVSLPPLPEQTAIAGYLDEKTAQLNILIDRKRRLIDLLHEEKIALINEAVTKGINPNVLMKDSGIEWLGEIPAHWEVKKLRHIAEIKTGSKNTEDRIDEGEYPFFVRSQTVERINSWSFDGEAILTAGDGVGVAKVFHYVNGKFDYHQRVYKLSDFSHIIGKLLFYYVRENLQKEVLRWNAKSTVDSLRLPMFQNFLIAYPNTQEEQIEITKFIDTETAKIDHTITRIEREIELMQEYRTALISEVVTGKVKVV